MGNPTCSQCSRATDYKRSGVEHASNGKTYDQKIYQCPIHDVWITVEEPREGEEET